MPPGGPGNKSHCWAIAWTERRAGPDGKSRSRSRVATTGTTDQAAAAEYLVRWKAAQTHAAAVDRVRDVLERYEAATVKRQRREGRAKRIIQGFESKIRHLQAHFGPLAVSELSAAVIEDYVDAERAHGLSDAAISAKLRYLRAALNRAEERGEIDRAPKIRTPGGDRPRKRSLTRAELRRLFEALLAPETEHYLRTLVLVALLTGQRSVHIRPLRWEHVDFESGTIWFTRANPNAAANKSCQDVPLVDMLGSYLLRAREAARTEWVIEHRGQPVEQPRKSWAKLLARAGIEGLQLRDLRRSVATIAAEREAGTAAVAALLNNDEAVTRRHYAHASGLLLKVVQTVADELA